MVPLPVIAPCVEAIVSDIRPLAQRLGSTASLAELIVETTAIRLPRVQDHGSLRAFLEQYRDQILTPIELPAIHQAYRHCNRSESRELIALDVQLAADPALQLFHRASKLVGQEHLERLRPMRDQRTVQRYLQAVAEGEAHAWHTLVYGLILSLYSLPLRQGLLHYSLQTLSALFDAAAASVDIDQGTRDRIWDDLNETLPAAVERVLGSESLHGP